MLIQKWRILLLMLIIKLFNLYFTNKMMLEKHPVALVSTGISTEKYFLMRPNVKIEFFSLFV